MENVAALGLARETMKEKWANGAVLCWCQPTARCLASCLASPGAWCAPRRWPAPWSDGYVPVYSAKTPPGTSLLLPVASGAWELHDGTFPRYLVVELEYEIAPSGRAQCEIPRRSKIDPEEEK